MCAAGAHPCFKLRVIVEEAKKCRMLCRTHQYTNTAAQRVAGLIPDGSVEARRFSGVMVPFNRFFTKFERNMLTTDWYDFQHNKYAPVLTAVTNAWLEHQRQRSRPRKRKEPEPASE